MKIAFFGLFMALTFVPIAGFSQIKCEKPTTVKQLGEVGHEGEKAFAAMDLTALLKHSTFAREEVLPCLTDALTTQDAAAFHRLMAMEAFTRRNDARALREFHAARKLVPGYILPEDLAEADHPLRTLYTQAEHADDGVRELVYPPIGGYITVGGVRNAPRFKESPVIVQVFDKDNRQLETRYVQPGETLPNWGLNNPLGVTARDLGIDTMPMWSKPNNWWIASAVAGAVAAGFYGAALYEKGRFEDTGTSDGELGGLRDRANGFGYTAIATGGLAIVMAGIGVGMQITFGSEDTPQTESMSHEGYDHGR